MSHIDNRPERCGVMRAALQTVQIDLDSAIKFYQDPQYHGLLLRAAQQVAAYAGEILANDRTLSSDDAAAFEQYLARKSGQDQTAEAAGDGA